MPDRGDCNHVRRYPPYVNEDQEIAYLPPVRWETMMGAASSAMGREAGRGLLTLANLITAAAPLAADWNNSHIFNQRWPSHARFHGVVALAMTQHAGRPQPLVVVVGLHRPAHQPPVRGGHPARLLGPVPGGAAGPGHRGG